MSRRLGLGGVTEPPSPVDPQTRAEEPRGNPSSADPGGGIGGESGLVGDSVPPAVRPAVGDSESKGDCPEEVSGSVVGTGTVSESAPSEEGNSLVPTTESPLIPSGELRAFLRKYSGHPDCVWQAIDHWSDLALLVRSVLSCSQAASGLTKTERHWVQVFLDGLEGERTGATCASVPPHD